MRKGAGLFLALLAAVSGPSVAAEPSDPPTPLVIEINTPRDTEARFRSESIQGVPISMTVFDRRRLEASEIRDIPDVVASSPSLNLSSSTGNQRTTNIAMRGVGAMVFSAGVDPATAFYVDEVFIANPAGFNIGLLDPERVEVLRGPQGILNGKNALAGAIRVTSMRARGSGTASGEVSAGSYGSLRGRAVVDGAIMPDRLFARLTAVESRRDGTYHNMVDDRYIDSRRNGGARLQFRAMTRDDLELSLSADFSRDRGMRGAGGDFDTILTRRVNVLVPYDEIRDNGGIHLNAVWHGKDVTTTSITALRGLHFNADGSDFSRSDLYYQGQRDDQIQFSQEIRFASTGRRSVDWVGGLYFLGEDYRTTSYQELHTLGPTFGTTNGHRETSTARQRTLNAAAFGEATWHLNDTVSAALGLRYTMDHKEIDYRHSSNDGTQLLAILQSQHRDKAFHDVSPSLTLSYSPWPTLTTYARTAHGYKGGGFNNIFVNSTKLDFLPETGWNHEVGAKSRWLDDRLELNAALFWFILSDQQVQSITNASGTRTSNAATSTSKGFEIGSVLRPWKQLALSADLAYADARFDSYRTLPVGSSSVDASGNHLPYGSRLSYTLGAEAHHFVTPWTKVLARLDYLYKGGHYFDAQNSLYQRGYAITNLKAGLAGERWEFSLWGRNLFDARYRTFAADNGSFIGRKAFAGDPMMVGASLRVEF